jgi:histidyl-tRNA synthetase
MEINSIGDLVCRPAFREALVRWGREHWNELCEDCHNRIDRNPLRLLDCKIDAKLAESAPSSLDFLCEDCRRHFDTVRAILDSAAIEHHVNPRLVRGLDYYTRTAFEVMAEGLGAQSTVLAGGRYDGLIETMGGAAVPGIGFAIGLERVALALQSAGLVSDSAANAVVIAMGEQAVLKGSSLARELRAAGLSIEMLSPDRKLKALLGRANKIGARFAVIIGENELARGVVQLRDLTQSAQREVPLTDVAAAIAEAKN